MKKFRVWKDLILRARIWVKSESILYQCMNAVGKVMMREDAYTKERQKEIKSCLEQ